MVGHPEHSNASTPDLPPSRPSFITRVLGVGSGRFTHADVFKLVRVADDSRKGEFGSETLATIHDLAGKQDNVDVFRKSS